MKNTHNPVSNKISLFDEIHNTCIDCHECQAECAFLKRYGTPRAILSAKDSSDSAFLNLAYECSLCGLCGAVCPVGLRPGEMFLEMRRAAVLAGSAPLKSYKKIMAYEKRGTSKRYTWYCLPENCDTVFFPGCALPGTRPGKTLALYQYLKTLIPGIGIVLDCCCKISRDLGRTRHYADMLSEMKSFLLKHGVKRILTACPNCHMIFTADGAPLEAISVYATLIENGPPPGPTADGRTITVHDPCTARDEPVMHDAARALARSKGLCVTEMAHFGEKTFCCGKGGAVQFRDPTLSAAWNDKRINEVDDRPMITYCAGCTQALKNTPPVLHILDLLFDPDCLATGKTRQSKWPLTYLNRLWLKYLIKKHENPAVFRERPPAR